MANVLCPRCQGRKFSLALLRLATGECVERVSNCSTCDGIGTISEEHELRIKRGEQLRRERVDRGESLRDCAERLGIDFIELSKIEQGRVP